MSSVSGKVFDLALLKRILLYAKPYSKRLWFAAILTLILGFIAPMRPWLIKTTLDRFILVSDRDGLLFMLVLIILVLMTEAVLQYWQTWTANWLGQSVIKDLRTDVYSKILSFNLGKFDKTPIGTLVTRVISDIETIAEIFSQGILIIIGDLLKLFLVVFVMFLTDWRLTLISLTSIPLLLIATSVFKNAIKSAFQEVRNKVSKLNAFVQEHITGMRIVQIFNREDREMQKFMQINADHRDAHIRSVMAYSIFFPVVEILSALSIALLIWWGGRGALHAEVTFGNIVAFILYIYMLFRPIRELANRFNILQMGMIASERIFRIIDMRGNIENHGKKKTLRLKGDVSFSQVWFAYKPGQWVIKDVSFDARAGETLALVGATGSGKTTIANLLGRYYEFQRGTIFIDGTDIRDYDISSLRACMALVPQDVFLFSDSVLNNITLRNDAITKKEVEHAAEMVGADRFIKLLPGKYNFNVQERGLTLSVGQRQLIAFIRAYVYNPGILILDEATSSIDTETEALIQHATEQLTRNRTSLIIAHRLATVRKADRIIVLDNGKILETGTHNELYNKNGFYTKLCQVQFADITL